MAADLRRALLISAGWLAALAERFNLDEAATRATLRHDGQIIGEFTLGEALDIADRALAPAAAPPGQTCAGGIDPGFAECPKCGATMDDECRAAVMVEEQPRC